MMFKEINGENSNPQNKL